MVKGSVLQLCAVAGLALAAPADAATLNGVGTYEGVAGVGTANGVVSAPPVGTSYVYVTTAKSTGTAGYGLGGEKNGSRLTTTSFTSAAGSLLDYYFNYVTTDGSGFSDYAYATLNNLTAGTSVTLFNARTTEVGDAVQGFGLPAIDPGTRLTPGATAITAGAPVWTALGPSSDSCFDEGCGYTGWIAASYRIAEAGDYSFTFGVTNWDDEVFASGLAIAGLKIDGAGVIDPGASVVPVPASAILLICGLGVLTSLRRRRSL